MVLVFHVAGMGVNTSVSMDAQNVRCQMKQFLILLIGIMVTQNPLGSIHLLRR